MSMKKQHFRMLIDRLTVATIRDDPQEVGLCIQCLHELGGGTEAALSCAYKLSNMIEWAYECSQSK